MTNKDLLTRLADAGEEAISKLADSPGADRLIGAVTGLRDRVDELQRRVRGIEDLERRVAALEARLAEPPATTTPASSPPTPTAEPGSSSSTGPDSPG